MPILFLTKYFDLAIFGRVRKAAGLFLPAACLLALCLPASFRAVEVYSHSSRDKHNLENGYLVYHTIVTGKDGKIVPWYSENPGVAYDHILGLVWKFWLNIRTDMNGLPYYMNHQIYREKINDYRGIGGDQFQVALESWRLYYGYSGDEWVLENMKFIADYYLTHGFSSADAKWPHMPFPYNTKVYSGIYDGDMILGKGFVQPDKAGAFAYELLQLYKMTSDPDYLEAAINIANTLAANTRAGDEEHSPLPFKVNAYTGENGVLKDSETGEVTMPAVYTSSCAGTLNLYLDLIAADKGNISLYKTAFDQMLQWMKKHPMQNNKWGPYFEDVSGWSNTQVNPANWVLFMLNHREYFPEWKKEAEGIIDWIYKEFGNPMWSKYGVTLVDEQTSFRFEGSSHSAHQASADLLYAKLSGDTSLVENAIRMLNWATYMVDTDGKNQYPVEAIWMTDGYGDYVRHYLRAMSVWPELMPENQNHLVSTSSAIKRMDYWPDMTYGNWEIALSEHELTDGKKHWPRIFYATSEKASEELFRLAVKPVEVQVSDRPIVEVKELKSDGWKWEPLKTGGLLTIQHTSGEKIKVIW